MLLIVVATFCLHTYFRNIFLNFEVNMGDLMLLCCKMTDIWASMMKNCENNYRNERMLVILPSLFTSAYTSSFIIIDSW